MSDFVVVGDGDDLEVVGVKEECIRSVLETIELEDRRFEMQEQISTHISISTDLVEYIRAVSLVISESEMVVIRGMISYGKTYLYSNIYDDVKKMRKYETKLIVRNKFVRKVISRGIPSPVQFNNRERIGIRLVSNIHGALLHISDEMHLDRKYIVELAIWVAFKNLFEEDDIINEMFEGDREFVDSLEIYGRLEKTINGLCDDYEGII